MKRNKSCKLTIDQEQEVIKKYLSGISARQLGKEYKFASHSPITAMLKVYNVEQRSPPERNRLYSLNPNIFDVIDSEHKAYWWGFIYADGTVHRRSLVIAIKYADYNHLEKLRDFMQSESPIKRTQNHNEYHKSDNAQISFTDRNLANRLRHLGVLAYRPQFELVLTNLPNELKQHWIRGYFDGDGSARKKPSISFVGRPLLLEFIREALHKECGTNPHFSIFKHTISDIYYLEIGGRIQAEKVTGYMYNNATVWLERKKQVVDSWPKPKPRKRDSKGRYI
jgi:hypothetical protein